MRSATHISLLALLTSLGATSVMAIPLDVVVQARMTFDPSLSANPDPLAYSIFGITDTDTVVNVSFTIESELATLVPAGTPVQPVTNSAFASDAYLFSSTAISNLNVFGNAGWTTASLTPFILGLTGLPYEVLFLGDLLGNPAVRFRLFDETLGAFGSITFGSATCSGTCDVLAGHSVFDFVTGSGAVLSENFTTVRPSVSVPEPSTLLLFAAGIAGLALQRRRNQVYVAKAPREQPTA